MSDSNGQHQAEEAELAAEFQELRDEVHVLRESIDELREVIEWALRNPERFGVPVQPGRRITSMPLDPTAPDFAERLNRLRPDDLPPEEPDADAVQIPNDEEGIEPGPHDPTDDSPPNTDELADQRSQQGHLFSGDITEPAQPPAALADSDRQEADESTARKEEGEAAAIPDGARFALRHHVGLLQEKARTLAQISETLGGRYVEEFWDDHGQQILASLERLQTIAKIARRNGVDLEPFVAELGGVPDLVRIASAPLAELRSRLLATLREEETTLGLRELRQAMGYPGIDPADPLGNPVNKILAEMRVAGDVVCHDSSWGQPLFSLPTVTDAKAATGSSPGSQAEGMEPLEEHRRPYTLDDFGRLYRQLHAGEIDLAGLRTAFAHLVASKDKLIATLVQTHNAKQLAIRAARFGCFDAKRNNKQQNAEHVVRAMMQVFTLSNSIRYNPMGGETYEDAIVKAVDELTEDDVVTYVEKHRTDMAAQEKANENPETLEEFRTFVRHRGEQQLGDTQLALFDRLQADLTREQRRQLRQSSTVEKIASDGADNLELTVKEGWHDRQHIPLYIVQLSTRVDSATFRELKIKAQQLGGWWSSFKKSDAGFQFKSNESAQKFADLLSGDADRSTELADRRQRKLEKAGGHLFDLAERIEAEAEEILAADAEKLKNTVRRAEMAASRRGYAYQAQAFAGTLRNIAAKLEEGTAVFLDGVRTKTQVDTLATLLRRAKMHRNQQLAKEIDETQGHWEANIKRQELDSRPLDQADVRFARYPYPSIYKRHLEEAVATAGNRRGVKQIARRMGKWISGHPDSDFIAFTDDAEVAVLTDFCNRCKAAGVQIEWIDRGLDDSKRLRAADIQTLPELRSALRELLPHLAKRSEDDPVTKAEDELRGRNLPGFFPTPPAIVAEMLDLAGIQPGQTVLEPSCGKGDILDAIRDRQPDAHLYAIEQNRTLQDILEAKGYDVDFGDFLARNGEYDRVLMNPPFEAGQDIEHVRHAYDCLVTGGRLVAIMSEGPFFREDRKAVEFREWLDGRDYSTQKLPEDVFKGVEVFRETGVRTRLIVIDKPGEA